jgi:hypothetical protein
MEHVVVRSRRVRRRGLTSRESPFLTLVRGCLLILKSGSSGSHPESTASTQSTGALRRPLHERRIPTEGVRHNDQARRLCRTFSLRNVHTDDDGGVLHRRTQHECQGGRVGGELQAGCRESCNPRLFRFTRMPGSTTLARHLKTFASTTVRISAVKSESADFEQKSGAIRAELTICYYAPSKRSERLGLLIRHRLLARIGLKLLIQPEILPNYHLLSFQLINWSLDRGYTQGFVCLVYTFKIKYLRHHSLLRLLDLTAFRRLKKSFH